MKSFRVLPGIFILFILFIALFAACNEIQPGDTPTVTVLASPLPTDTPTSLPPTPTPVPLAATVNGVGITMEEFEAELDRYMSAVGDVGMQPDPNPASIVLDELISQLLFTQAAAENGYNVDDEFLQKRIGDLITVAGGELAFENWLNDNGYTDQSFKQALTRSIMVAWMRDQILAEVPQKAEQVHVRQIFLLDRFQADQVFTELQSGKDFATLAESYDPVGKGDLGWFPRGFLPHPAVEEAAFNMAVGEITPVIETSVGYHILQLLEKDPDYPLSPEARLIWQERALQEWIDLRREESEIVINTLQ
ncbi:MAG: peptidylprolyl isomerase [Chloroflexota bacterium]|nr:MAG: peptidylprolyl isomerase [Chloroflexota bacterium]